MSDRQNMANNTNIQASLIELFSHCYKKYMNDRSLKDLSDVTKNKIYLLCSQKASNGLYVIFDNAYKSWVLQQYSSYTSNSKLSEGFNINEYIDPHFFEILKDILKSLKDTQNKRTLEQNKVDKIIEVLTCSKENVISSITSLGVADRIVDIVEENKTRVNELDEKANKLKNELKTQSRKALESSITILGIFVGVAMVFFGGFAILDNTIEGLNATTPQRLIFVMLAFAMIMYNSVILLFFLISRITEKSIGCKCHRYFPIVDNTKEESKDKNRMKGSKSNQTICETTNCWNCKNSGPVPAWCRIKRIYPYIYWGNVAIVAAMISLFILWLTYKMWCVYKNFWWLWVLGAIGGIVISLKFVRLAYKYPKTSDSNTTSVMPDNESDKGQTNT